jgi:hypothetical protein
MKLNERGLGTGAIVGIVVAIVAVAIVVPVSLIIIHGGGSAAFSSIPTYPGATDSGIDVAQAASSAGGSLPSGWSGKAYYTTATPSTVVSWYNTNMSGWTKTADNTITAQGYSISVLSFTKGSDAAVIEALAVSGQNLIIVMAGPTSGIGTPTENQGTTGATTTT